MLSRLAARTITGPVAFLAAGVADLFSYWALARRRQTRAL